VVVDTSALLAVLFGEPPALRIAEALTAAGRPLISAVNYTECLIRVWDRAPGVGDALDDSLAGFAFEIVPIDRPLAVAAARARLRYPINLGDCYAYALAKDRGMPLLTLDRDFARTDVVLVDLDARR
jgi:ribonuclease VapC